MRKPNLATSLIILNLILIASLIFLSTNQWVKAQSTQLPSVPPLISYQGFLTDDAGQPIDGSRDIVFRIYALAYDSIVLWQETHAGVQVSAGDFSVHLGEFTPFPEWLFNTPERWLEIQIEGVFLSPRQRFTSVPYALNADKLDGYDSQEILAGQLPPGAIVWFPESRSPEGYSPHPTALGEDVGPWEPIAVLPVSLIGMYSCNIWTGSDVLCWGSHEGQPKGVRYKYSENKWYSISTLGSPESINAFSSIWTGTEMIVWGGLNSTIHPLNSGARYNPVTDTWLPISLLNAPSPRLEHSSVWTGSEMIIWGGSYDGSNLLGDGFRYNPINDTWQAINLEGSPSARSAHVGLWTGSEMIVFGGYAGGSSYYADGALYNPITDRWRVMNKEGAVTGVTFPNTSSAVWTGSEMVFSYGNHLLFFNPVSNTWRDRHCFQFNLGAGAPLGEQISLIESYLITQGMIYELIEDKTIVELPINYWSSMFWTGQDLLILDVPGFSGSITGLRHQIELIFPYQKD